jgi:DNA-binding NarL/FixJ family response regulator
VNAPIRVLIIGDGRLFIEAVGLLISRQKGVEFVGFRETLNGQHMISLTESPDIALVAASMKGTLTARLVQRLSEEAPYLKVIVFGLDNEPGEALEYIEAGAVGYIPKDKSFADLINLIEAVYQERTLCSSALALTVFARISELSHAKPASRMGRQVQLTTREKEVLSLIAENLSNKEIAGHLGITLNTVKNHVHHILEKFGVSYRRELARTASACGII